MASAGLLLLLLVSSSLILSSLSAPSSSNQQGHVALQKRTDAKKGALTAVKTIEKILTAASPFFGLIPIHGTLISAILSLGATALSAIGMIENNPNLALLKEFENLNMKIDKNHKELKWNIWATQYQVHENKISVAWEKFQKLVKVLASEKTVEQKEKEKTTFKKEYKSSVDETNLLASKVTSAKEKVFTLGLKELLSDKVNCHEDVLKTYIARIYELIYEGSVMNLFYYSLQGLDRADEIANTFYDVTSALFKIQIYCISNPEKYVENDVKGLIDDTKKTDLAKKIRVFLEKNYGRYDWMVVVFLTKNSKHETLTLLNKHILSGFTEVKNVERTAAVARQVKGTHTKAAKVSEAIKKCVKDSVLCKDVPKTLEKCKITDYTAVHAFISKGHDSSSAKDAKESHEEMSPDRPAAKTPFFYKGKCSKSPLIKTGKFIVLIKSDEEIEKKDPCAAKKCGGKDRGKCEVLKNTLIPVCQCEKPFYGEECEESLDDYKKKMKEGMPKN